MPYDIYLLTIKLHNGVKIAQIAKSFILVITVTVEKEMRRLDPEVRMSGTIRHPIILITDPALGFCLILDYTGPLFAVYFVQNLQNSRLSIKYLHVL